MDYAERYLKELEEDYPSYYAHLQLTSTLNDLARDFQKRADTLEESLKQHFYYDQKVTTYANNLREHAIINGFVIQWIMANVYSEMVKAFAVQREEYYEDYHRSI